MAAAEINIAELREKKRRRRRYLIVAAAFFAAYLIFLGAVWVVLRSPIFRIKKINIIGNEQIIDEEIYGVLKSQLIRGSFLRALLGINNILIWPNGLSADGLVFLPEAKSVNIEKNLGGQSVTVSVEERNPYGIWCYMQTPAGAERAQIGPAGKPKNDAAGLRGGSALSQRESAAGAGGSCWWFDEEGFIFRRSPAVQGGLIIAVDDYSQKEAGLNSHILPQEFIANLFSVFDVLKSSGLSAKEIRLNDLSLEEIEADTYPAAEQVQSGAGGGPKLYFSLRFPAANDLAVIKDFLSKPGFDKLQYLDFRVQNRVYYK